MEFEDVKIGMKVVPISKSVGFGGAGLDRSYSWSKAKEMNQLYLFVTGFDEDDSKVVLCSSSFSDITLGNGDFFLSKDLIPYEEVL